MSPSDLQKKHLVLAPQSKFEYNYQVNSTRAYKKAAVLFQQEMNFGSVSSEAMRIDTDRN